MTRFASLASRLLGGAFLSLASLAHAGVGDIAVVQPFAVPTPPGATTGAGYIRELSNKGAADDRLVGVSAAIADHVEMHSMTMDGNVMRMRQVPAIVIPAKGTVDLSPGHGYHLMLVGLKQPLKVGDRIPVTLTFEKAGPVDVDLAVQPRTSGAMH